MTNAEKRLSLFRKIDNLNNTDLDIVYNKLIALLNSVSLYNLSDGERKLINRALEHSSEKESYTTKEVIEEAKNKYPKLKFKWE